MKVRFAGSVLIRAIGGNIEVEMTMAIRPFGEGGSPHYIVNNIEVNDKNGNGK